MRLSFCHMLSAAAVSTIVSMAGCGGNDGMPMPPSAPSPTPVTTASAYILPGAVSLDDFAFGDEPVVIYTGERLRWVNADTLTHAIVADSPASTDFRATGELPGPGGEQSFVMTKPGTTRIHCETHPNMTGTLVVREN